MTTPPTPQPTVTPTRLSTLVSVVMVAGGVSWLLVGRFYGSIPQLTWFPALTLALLAVTEAVLAPVTKARIDRRPGTRPLHPLAGARLTALAKASMVGGALFGGAYGGFFLWVFTNRDRLAAAAEDVPRAGVGALASVALLLAALWLEHACRIPKPPTPPEASSS
jgi:hypothetical protein